MERGIGAQNHKSQDHKSQEPRAERARLSRRPVTSLPTANRFRFWRSLAAGLLALGALLGLAGEARAQTTAPGAPTNLTVASIGPGSVTLTWEAPTDNGGAAITHYQYRKGPGAPVSIG